MNVARLHLRTNLQIQIKIQTLRYSLHLCRTLHRWGSSFPIFVVSQIFSLFFPQNIKSNNVNNNNTKQKPRNVLGAGSAVPLHRDQAVRGSPQRPRAPRPTPGRPECAPSLPQTKPRDDAPHVGTKGAADWTTSQPEPRLPGTPASDPAPQAPPGPPRPPPGPSPGLPPPSPRRVPLPRASPAPVARLEAGSEQAAQAQTARARRLLADPAALTHLPPPPRGPPAAPGPPGRRRARGVT
ncbi:basic proline-rich protein-like [Canis lupus familiaris]|uniref:basic proline-rich protein-like n=1 Tax=Canis lupus familiaris TaxID=9615 RepID=UPI0018F7E17E|nr:basic proline-rich protein-like [Canis lupus familiaris]